MDERTCPGCGGLGCPDCDWRGAVPLCQHRYEVGLGVLYCVLCGQDAPDQTPLAEEDTDTR